MLRGQTSRWQPQRLSLPSAWASGRMGAAAVWANRRTEGTTLKAVGPIGVPTRAYGTTDKGTTGGHVTPATQPGASGDKPMFPPNDTKTSTGLTGVRVVPYARNLLRDKYEAILKHLADGIPKDAAYRQRTEAFYAARLAIVQDTALANDAAVEEALAIATFGKQQPEAASSSEGKGKACAKVQLEELLIEANDELELVRWMKKWRPWEPLATPAPLGQWDNPFYDVPSNVEKAETTEETAKEATNAAKPKDTPKADAKDTPPKADAKETPKAEAKEKTKAKRTPKAKK